MVRIEGFRDRLNGTMRGLQNELVGLSWPERVAVCAPIALQSLAVKASRDNGSRIERTVAVMEEVNKRIELINKSPAWKQAYRKRPGLED